MALSKIVRLSSIFIAVLHTIYSILSSYESEINLVKVNQDEVDIVGEDLLGNVKKIEEQYKRNSVMPNSLAVVHMGIPKTGSSSIQSVSINFIAQLREDGYEIPLAHLMNQKGESYENSHYRQNLVQLSTCFIPRTHRAWNNYGCAPELLSTGLEIAKENKNIFISAEGFSNSDREGLNALSVYLSHWDDKKIIIYYRRLYDWVISLQNQITKQQKISENRHWETKLTDHFVYDDVPVVPFIYTSEIISRAREFFDDVVVVNMHDTNKGLTETFYCDILPNATHICDAVIIEGDEHKNSGKPLIYQTLAYGAKKYGQIEIETDEQMEKAIKAIRRYHKNRLNLTYKDFQMKCLPPKLKTWLFETSMNIEQTLFPEFFNKTAFEEDFEEKAKFGLCELDVESVLEQFEWKVFFKYLKGRL